MTYSVYILKSPNGKVYIGVTKKNPTLRWAYGKGYKQNKELYADIRKYGWNKFDKEILFTTESREEASNKEIEMISEYKSTDTIRGYNKLPGGNLMRDETIEKMKEKYEGRYPYWCEKKNQSKLARARRSRTLRNLHRSAPKRGESPVARKIDCYDKSMNFVERFPSIMDACDKYRIDHASIVNCCRGKRPSAGGFVWRYEGETFLPILKGRTEYMKKVVMMDMKGNDLKVFASISEAAKFVGGQRDGISKCCSGKIKSSAGYKWRYADE